MGEDGVLLCPTFPGSGVATYHKESYFKPINVMYTAIFNAIGVPATVVPIGLSKSNEPGLPMSIQVKLKCYFKFKFVIKIIIYHQTSALAHTNLSIIFYFQIVASPMNDRITLSLAKSLERPFGGWIPPFSESLHLY